jgi:hypothetical protein
MEKYRLPGLENRDYGRGDPLRRPRNTFYQLKLALTSPRGCDRSVGIVRFRTQTTDFSLVHGLYCVYSFQKAARFSKVKRIKVRDDGNTELRHD